MSKEIYISSTPHETRLAIVENEALTEIYYERENEYTLAGSIYNGRVTRVLPGMQSSFVEIGLERDAFLYITDFMEEAGDSADFESTHAGGADPAARGPVIDGDRARSDRGDGRRDRGRSERGQDAPEVLEVGGAPASMPAVEAPAEDRSGQRERNGRGGRGRRGRRDGRPDGVRTERTVTERSGSDRVAEPASAGQDEGQPDFSGRSAAGSTQGQGSGNDVANEEQGIGEGAPGADGSRRWRGRRGRRRGRGPGQGASGQEVGAGLVDGENGGSSRTETGKSAEFEDRPNPVEASPMRAAEPEGQPSQARETVRASGRVIERSSSAREEAGDAAPESATGEEQRRRSEGGNEREGNRSSRGRESRGGGEGRQGDRGRRVPRGFEPRKNLYGVDNAAADTEAAEPEPERIVLPGESLSRYRNAGESSVPAAQSFTSPVTPSPAFTLSAGWDGGTVLPGESLSRHRGGEVRTQDREERRDEPRGGRPGRDDRSSRGGGRDQNGRGERERGDRSRQEVRTEPSSGAPAQPVVREHIHPMAAAAQASSAEVEQSEASPRVDASSDRAEHVQHVAGSADAHSGQPAEAAIPDEVPAVSADPLATGRQDAMPGVGASVTLDHEPAQSVQPRAAATETEPVAASASYRVDPAPPSEYRLSQSPRGGGDGGGVMTEDAPRTSHQSTELETSSEPQHTAGHSTTTIEATGNMHSEPTTGVPPPPMPGQDLAEPTAPILHEMAVVQPLEQESGPGFAPGMGELEEELIEDDDTEAMTLNAGADEGLDDLEEETLEGGADLGTMLREMTIDQMVRPGAPSGEEDEGDFLEEDFEEPEELPGVGQGRVEDQERDEAQDAGHDELQQPGERENAPLEATANQEPRRDRRDRDGRVRDGRRGGREPGRRGDSERRGSDRDRGMERARRTGGSGDRGPGRGRSMQATNLPAISDLLKPGQEILVQIAKEPIAKKGARITSHIALPGRFLVFMPTVSHTGVSRKIESDVERQRLKRILLSEKGEAAGGFIVRTAAAGASEEELRSDLRFLLNLWTDIRQRSESSKSPALIYHDLNLVERVLRDQVTDTFSAIWVDTESDYERILKFLQRFQPSLIRRVKLYTKDTPLFEQFGITEEINKALRSKVWLKSGGSIVINQTEALVAIDINTGKFVGKTARLEDTIVKTNLDAIPEIVRQIRLRDLGGIIILDFIDMDERKNRNRVMAALEEELKTDRAPSKVLQFNDFGLVAITRKRVKQSLERTLSTTCSVCVGTGMVKSPVTVCNDIYIEMRKMHKNLERGDIMLRVHPEVVKQLKVAGGRWLQDMEEMAGKTILVKSDPSLHPEQFDIH